jgi:hypothetical protein
MRVAIVLVDDCDLRPVAVHQVAVPIEFVLRLAADGEDWSLEIPQLLYRIKLALVEQQIVRGLIRAGVRIRHPGNLRQHQLEVAQHVPNRRERGSRAAQVPVFQLLECRRRVACEKPLARPRTSPHGDVGIFHRHVDSIRHRKFERILLKNDIPHVGEEHIAELAAVLQQIIVIEKVPVIVDVDWLWQRLGGIRVRVRHEWECAAVRDHLDVILPYLPDRSATDARTDKQADVPAKTCLPQTDQKPSKLVEVVMLDDAEDQVLRFCGAGMRTVQINTPRSFHSLPAAPEPPSHAG